MLDKLKSELTSRDALAFVSTTGKRHRIVMIDVYLRLMIDVEIDVGCLIFFLHVQ